MATANIHRARLEKLFYRYQLMIQKPTQPKLIPLSPFNDSRGSFLKLLSPKLSSYPDISWKEFFFNESKRAVIRGFHPQAEPAAFTKAVCCISGSVFDVLIDLRKNSPKWGQPQVFNLSATEPNLLLIPPGFAHGFQSLADHTQMLYATDQEFKPELEIGFSWRSFENLWPLQSPIVSEKDDHWPVLSDLYK